MFVCTEYSRFDPLQMRCRKLRDFSHLGLKVNDAALVSEREQLWQIYLCIDSDGKEGARPLASVNTNAEVASVALIHSFLSLPVTHAHIQLTRYRYKSRLASSQVRFLSRIGSLGANDNFFPQFVLIQQLQYPTVHQLNRHNYRSFYLYFSSIQSFPIRSSLQSVHRLG